MASPTYDMSAPTSERKLSSRYVEYLAAYGRRLKRSAGGAAADRAGRPCGEPYRGPVGPTKGKRAAPPADGREAPPQGAGVRMVEGAWARGAPTDVLCVGPRPASAAEAPFRPSVRPNRPASASAMHGAAAMLDDEVRALPSLPARGAQMGRLPSQARRAAPAVARRRVELAATNRTLPKTCAPSAAAGRAPPRDAAPRRQGAHGRPGVHQAPRARRQ
jgi:hypothetical protein